MFARSNRNRNRNIFLAVVGGLFVLILIAGCGLAGRALLTRGGATSVSTAQEYTLECRVNGQVVDCAEAGLSVIDNGAATAETADNGPTWIVVENGKEVEKPFPQTAEAFVAAVAAKCTQLEHDSGCVYLTSEMVTPIRDDEDESIIVGWELLFERNGQGMFYEWTTVNVPSSSMQYGAMREFELRARCGLTPAEVEQLGYIDDMIGYAIPGNAERVPVEGASFYADQSEELGKLENQTWAQRCSEEPKVEIVEGVGGDGSWTPDYSMESMLAEFGLQDEYDSGTIVVSDEPGACWNVQTATGGVSFEITNGRSEPLPGWIPPETTGIPAGFSGQVYGFSVCGP